jgi:uncharacterized protein YeaO (DUF488 family)
MSVRIVRLGTPRTADEGLRIGTVRRPPRGVAKAKFSSENWYDVWLPTLAPSAAIVKLGLQADTPAKWSAFARRYRAEMTASDAKHVIELLARLSQTSNFSVGCYCENPERCHRSILEELLAGQGAMISEA